MTNTLNTPIEALEIDFPLRLVRYALRSDSGGAGQYRGGDGMIREGGVAGSSDSHHAERTPCGRAVGTGGRPTGQRGSQHVRFTPTARRKQLPSKFSRRVQPGERLRIETPGGGGWGVAVDKASESTGEAAS